MSEAIGEWAVPAPAPSRVQTGALGLRLVQFVYCAFVVSIPLETIFYFRYDAGRADSTVSLSRVLGVALLAAAASQWRSCFRKQPLAFWMAVWYLAVLSLSQLWIPSAAFPRFHELQFTLIQMTALFLLSINLLADAPFRQRLFRVYGWWTAAIAAAMLLGAFNIQFDLEGRDSIMSQDANATACMFSLAALCLAGDQKLLAARRGLARAVFSLGAIGVLVMAVLRTGSRSGLLAFCAGFLALAFAGGGKARSARVAAAAVVLALLGGLLVSEFNRGTVAAARLERSWDSGDTAGRDEIYREAWSMFLAKPLLGYGGANNRAELGARLNYPDRDTHNVFLAVLTEVGLVGGAAFFGCMLYGLVNGWRGGRASGDAVPFALMCALVVVNTAITGSREKLFWIVLAAAVASGLRSSLARARDLAAP